MHLVQTTLKSRAQAERMADALLGSGAAKCVSHWGIRSAYLWKGKKVLENEIVLEAKCADAASARKAASLIEKLHPYEVPMVLVLPVERANPSYKKWLEC